MLQELSISSGTLSPAFGLMDTTYTITANRYIRAQQAAVADSSSYFGSSVAIDGDTMVVGAYAEDNNYTGVLNGTSYAGTDDELHNSSGAVYVYY